MISQTSSVPNCQLQNTLGALCLCKSDVHGISLAIVQNEQDGQARMGRNHLLQPAQYPPDLDACT